MQLFMDQNQTAETSRFQLFLWVWFAVFFLEKLGRPMGIGDFQGQLSIIATLATLLNIYVLTCRTNWISILLITIFQAAIHRLNIPGAATILPRLAHWYIVDIGNLILSCAAITALFKEGRNASLYRIAVYAAPAIRAFLICALVSAGFAKLNSNFFSVEDSCGVQFYEILNGIYHWMPNLWFVKQVVPGYVIFCEIISPCLLLFRRTRLLAALFICTLMFGLGAINIFSLYEFSGLFLSMVILFLPAAAIQTLFFEVSGPMQRWKLTFTQYYSKNISSTLQSAGKIAACFLLVGLVLLKDLLHTDLINRIPIQIIWWFINGVFILTLFYCWRCYGTDRAPTWRLLRPRSYINLCIVVVFVFLESLTYIGIGHFPAMIIAASLQVNRAYSNHFIVQSVPDLGFNRVTTIVSSDDPELPVQTSYSWFPLNLFLLARPQYHTTVNFEDGLRISTPLLASPFKEVLKKISTPFLIPLPIATVRPGQCSVHNH